jgi:hypothetical protein
VAQRPLPSEIIATCKPGPEESASSGGCAGADAGGREVGIGTTREAAGNGSLLSTALSDSMGLSSLRREETVPTGKFEELQRS